MTRLPRPTLRALRSVVARAYGVRRSRVRVVDRAFYDRHRLDDREVMVRLVATGRGDGRDWWSMAYTAGDAIGDRHALRYVARRARAGDLP